VVSHHQRDTVTSAAGTAGTATLITIPVPITPSVVVSVPIRAAAHRTRPVPPGQILRWDAEVGQDVPPSSVRHLTHIPGVQAPGSSMLWPAIPSRFVYSEPAAHRRALCLRRHAASSRQSPVSMSRRMCSTLYAVVLGPRWTRGGNLPVRTPLCHVLGATGMYCRTCASRINPVSGRADGDVDGGDIWGTSVCSVMEV